MDLEIIVGLSIILFFGVSAFGALYHILFEDQIVRKKRMKQRKLRKERLRK
tara:strand:- start:387 stop:539 length:153 start_codon:yes stop_codon:yes gene_type:complete